MSSVLKVLRAGSPDARIALERLSKRLAALENLDSTSYRARVKKIFGRVSPPSDVVARILEDVGAQGDRALIDYTRRIDGVRLTPRTLRVSDTERRAGYRRTPPAVRKALALAARRIAGYQKRLLPPDLSLTRGAGPAGVCTGLAWSPLRRVGLYVPGGTAAYPSSVLMNAVPAQVAGVREIALATPCGPGGRLNDGVLCACEILGLRELYRMGGAQAIAAFAFGTRSVPRVDKIAGPGNLFVMLAKRAVFGQVDIDMLAGPSEVLVLADRHARADWIAADLLAQAEHDVLASCVLLTDSQRLAAAVQAEVDLQIQTLPRKKIAAAALRAWGLALVTKNMSQAVAIANELAPEHLEIMTRRPPPRVLAKQIRTAGAIFLGPHATEPLGDYLAGPSHTLPTGGTARAFSGVSVYTFLHRTSLIEADEKGLKALGRSIQTLAEAEGLEAHRRAVACRVNDGSSR